MGKNDELNFKYMLDKVCHNEEERIRITLMMVACSANIGAFLIENKDKLDIPQDILYNMAVISENMICIYEGRSNKSLKFGLMDFSNEKNIEKKLRFVIDELIKFRKNGEI